MQLICSNNIGREDILTIGKVYEGKESYHIGLKKKESSSLFLF